MNNKNPKNKKKQISEKDKLKKKIKCLEEEIKKLKKIHNEKENELLLSYADLQNYIKRKEKDFSINKIEIKKKYLTELIDVMELLKSANLDKNPKKGLNLIMKNIENFLEDEQIEYIDCIGKTFDHNLHHAVSVINKDDCKDEKIVEEVKKGYLINGNLLRPSQVIVAKKRENK
jgi:molecular chaperone GrpE